MFNSVIMLGNLTRDCELRYLPNGGAVCTTGLATNRRFKKTDGSQGEEVCFIDITFFGRTAEIANQYLSRGKKVLIEGRLKLDQWTDQQGVKRSKHSITVESLQMIDSKSHNESESEDESPQRNGGVTYEVKDEKGNVIDRGTMPNNIPDIDINDDIIPF